MLNYFSITAKICKCSLQCMAPSLDLYRRHVHPKVHASVPAASSVVVVKEKSDRNCPECAKCTSVRISLMGLLYRNYLEKSMRFLNGIAFYTRSLHSPCTTFSRSAFFIKYSVRSVSPIYPRYLSLRSLPFGTLSSSVRIRIGNSHAQ